jgi:DNA-binding MarR family transcriptional regulator
MIVDRMERDGLVERKRDVKDRRSLRLITTEKRELAFQQAVGYLVGDQPGLTSRKPCSSRSLFFSVIVPAPEGEKNRASLSNII